MPAGQDPPAKHGRFFYSRARDCRACDLARLCLSKGRVNKAVVVGNDYPALLRARRRRTLERGGNSAGATDGARRASWRGEDMARTGAFPDAVAINPKRLAAALAALLLQTLTIVLFPSPPARATAE
jgi:hypothetical protein